MYPTHARISDGAYNHRDTRLSFGTKNERSMTQACARIIIATTVNMNEA